MEPADVQVIRCLHCQAENPPGSATCASCGRPLPPVGDSGQDEIWWLPADRAETARRTYHLSTLMLLVAVIAVCLGVMREVPGLGVLLILLMVPALIRTLAGAARRQSRGSPMPWEEKLVVFLSSLGIVFVIGFAALIAFVTTCFPAGLVMFGVGWQFGLIVAVIVGLVAAGLVFYHLGRVLWPQKEP
jgi:hypothetical protein